VSAERERRLVHVLGAIESRGERGAERTHIETWIQTTLRCSGQTMYNLLKDLRTRRWALEVGGRFVLTKDGAAELALSRTVQPTVATHIELPPDFPSDDADQSS
jgi:hypothetical protein